MTHQAIRIGFRQARQTPRSRHRDIAEAMGITEAELVAAHCGSFVATESPLQATRLRAQWPEILAAVTTIGEVMALTRNAHAVHEKIGPFLRVDAHDVRGDQMTLQASFDHWVHGFAAQEVLLDGSTQRSLQFFDAQGQAIHKIYLRARSDANAYVRLCEQFTADVQSPGSVASVPWVAAVERQEAAVDVAALHQAWVGQHAPQAWHAMLQRFGISHAQALQLAPPDYAQPLPAGSLTDVLSQAAQLGLPMAITVANSGMVQTHTGPIRRVEVMGPWVNVLDEHFNLHVREDRIACAWLVKRPSAHSLEHALEMLDAQGGVLLTLRSARQPGQAEPCNWREILAQLATDVDVCATTAA
jgi:putative hemin transport protein